MGSSFGANRGHTILLGGIGGDSHSVGLTILRQALTMSGYRVLYLGTQNSLEGFFQLASLANVVMISSMDGHTRYYLKQFPELMKRYHMRRPLWYLGGNLHIGEAQGYESHFLEMGFDRVFVKFIDVATVLKLIKSDLASVDPVANCETLWKQAQKKNPLLDMAVSDGQVDSESFETSRREVLEHWKTGRHARNLEENAEFLAIQKSFTEAQALVNEKRMPMLIQPRSGVAIVDEQIKLFKAFKGMGVRALSYQVDSLTRNNRYSEAEEAIGDSHASGVSTLNGFPVINHGVPGLRRVISEVRLPLQTRHSTRDPRLLAEISYAGGVTAFEGGAICYNIPYYKDYPLSESLNTWQYVDRLTGLYYERFGIRLDREFFGTLTATLIPPSLAIAVNTLEAILAIQQGVKCVSLGYAEQGNRIQDVAAIRMLKEIAQETISNLGHKDIQVSTVFHQYMAAFPDASQRAEDLIFNSAITAALSGATRAIAKTPVEAYKIPTMEDNLQGISLVMRGVSEASAISLDEVTIADECEIIRQEVRAILDSIIYCGHGSITEGIVAGFRQGYIDIPFSPSIYNAGKVMTVRDTQGAVRYLSTGNLQFDRDLREFHREKISERRRAEGLLSERQNYLLVEKDVMQIPRGQYVRWPLVA
jgi:methylaspartate mutase epsilon subunit